MLNPICVVLFPSENTVKHRRWNFVRKCFTSWRLQQLFNYTTELNLPVWWSSAFRCLIWLVSNSKCDSESCYVRHDEDTSHSQHSEAATIGALWKKGFLEVSQNSQECTSLFFNKVAGLRPATLLKKRPWHWYFPVNFAKFLRTPFLQNTPGRLLLFCWTSTSFKAFGCI